MAMFTGHINPLPTYEKERVIMSSSEPIRIAFMRTSSAPGAILVDSNLRLHSILELRVWAERKKTFVIIDESTGEDVTQLLLAHRSATVDHW
jgi:hypothetical protein